jgi:hypothetical protein
LRLPPKSIYASASERRHGREPGAHNLNLIDGSGNFSIQSIKYFGNEAILMIELFKCCEPATQ